MDNKYEEMSDHELSEAVALKCGYEVNGKFIAGKVIIGAGGIGDNYTFTYFDINNPSDMWPIILKNKINTNFHQHGSLSTASIEIDAIFYRFTHKTPLRAAAIVFLMIKDSENEQN